MHSRALILLFSTISCVSARPYQNLLFQSEQILNLTSGEIDRRFSIKELKHETAVDAASFVGNTIACIAHLGVEDFRGIIDESQACSLSRWNDVKIALVPSMRRGRFERRYAIWGLYLGLCLMIEEGFVNTIFSLFWEKELVGTIFVTRTSSPLIGQFDTPLNDTLIDQIQNATMIDAMSEDVQNDIDVEVSFVPRGQLFDAIGAAAVLAKLMISAAAGNSESRIRDSVTTKRGYSEWVAAESVLPLRGPPWMFTNRRVLDAALKVATWMADNNKNRELVAAISFNGKVIGKLHGSSGAEKSVETS